MSAPTIGDSEVRAPGLRRLVSLDARAFRLVLIVFAGLGATYAVMCLKAIAIGLSSYGYADFHPLWVSGVLAHSHAPLVNYDAAALHAEQVRLGVDPHRENPFPYPPTFLLLLAPLGALPLPVAYWVFMSVSGGLFVLAMVAGRSRDLIWPLAAFAAPATGITIVSGQSGFLSGALMVGGLRLASSRPLIAGALFGLLTYKPQLGVLVPLVLLSAALWRVAAAATATALACVVASGLAFGFAVWPAWLHQLSAYADGYDVVVDLMPTLYANVRASAGPLAAGALQAVAALAVGLTIWRACRAGVTEQALALVVVGTFLATPHAFNYDMPMTSAAIAVYLGARARSVERVEALEVAVVAAVFVTPLAILAARGALVPWSWTPLAAMFVLMNMRDFAGAKKGD
jgi:Glycosyltransferase family 87